MQIGVIEDEPFSSGDLFVLAICQLGQVIKRSLSRDSNFMIANLYRPNTEAL